MIFNLIKHAKELLFDKTGTSLEADNVQDAITEIDNDLIGHTHDDRYYTETEINTLLSGKLDSAKITITTANSKTDATGAFYGVNVPTGYIPVSAWCTSSTNLVALIGHNSGGTRAAVRIIHQDGSVYASANVSVTIVWVRLT